MYWMHLTAKQKARSHSTAEIQNPFADQSESLRWTALMITGSEELAEQSIIDATDLDHTRSRAYRDWLVLWAHLATARTALNAIRSPIQEAAKRYADWTCSHHSHEPLSTQEIRALQELDPYVIIRQLDSLARSVLVLRGCHGAAFDDCVVLLNVPLHSAVGAYCTAVEWCAESTGPPALPGHVPEDAVSLWRPGWTFGGSEY